METNPLQVPIALLDRFSAPLKRAESKIKKTQARLNATNEKLAALELWKKQKQAVDEASAAMARAKSAMASLERPTPAAIRALLEKQRIYHKTQSSLNTAAAAMHRYGINARNADVEERKLRSDAVRLSKSLEEQKKYITLLTENAKAWRNETEKLSKSQSLAANMSFVGDAVGSTGRSLLGAVKAPIGVAVDFEQAISRLGAVV